MDEIRMNLLKEVADLDALPVGAYNIRENGKAAGVPGAIEHIALDVNDIEAAYAEIRSRGFEELEDGIQFLPFWERGVRYFTIMGPEGEKVEFNQKL